MNDVSKAPAPWQLNGRGFISLLRSPVEWASRDQFTPASLRKRPRSGLSMMMFVDYADSPVGPYHELLFIPGRFPFEDGKSHFSISRIFVSTQASVVNGRNNWGIPKELADFKVDYRARGETHIEVSQNGQDFAALDYRHYRPGLPAPGGIIPRPWRCLAQHWEDKTFIYTPRASGWAHYARLVKAEIDPQVFPDVTPEQCFLSTHLSRFDMEFPIAEIRTKG